MEKRGFTLIELLAVIVILAIIALIATPAVLNIIEDSKKDAAEASAKNIAKSAETYYMTNYVKGVSTNSIDLSGETLNYKGDKASKGYVLYDNNGNASGKMYINGYCVTFNFDNSVTSEKSNENDCDTSISYPNGYALYFNPVTGVSCKSNEEGCMKWYAFLDSSESDNVKLLLDHNIVAVNNTSTVKSNLDATTKNWVQVIDGETISLSARLISATEINQIVPTAADYVWDINDRETGYEFATGKHHKVGGTVEMATGTNSYAWLFDNTDGCTTYGCNVDDSSNSGYWTSDSPLPADDGTKYSWGVSNRGTLYSTWVGNWGKYGGRPVIEVSKNVFK